MQRQEIGNKYMLLNTATIATIHMLYKLSQSKLKHKFNIIVIRRCNVGLHGLKDLQRPGRPLCSLKGFLKAYRC